MAWKRIVVGGTGHRGLPAPTVRLVVPALRKCLAACAVETLVGVSSLADGADQIFARAILALGGSLEIVLAAERYREDLPAWCWPSYDRLLARASNVHYLDYELCTNEAHMEAGRLLVDRCDVLVAVWDGLPARGMGGTGDVVAYARERGVPVEVVWPDGSFRGTPD